MKLIQGIALSLLLMIAFQASARTINPADLVIEGGYTPYQGKSEITQLFVDKTEDGTRTGFWVKVTDNPGTFVPFADTMEPPPQQPIKIYIKHFPVSRYVEVLKQLRRISHFGVVNPYLDGVVICDGPNSTIRRGTQKVIMAYNCGSDAPDADQATFKSETLIKALRDETLQAPDLQGVLPQ